MTAERQRQAETVAEAVRGAGFGLDEAVKWGRLTFTRGGNWDHWVCAVASSAKGTRVVFHKGVLLADPRGLLRGSGAYVRALPADVALADPAALRELIADALEHQTDMR